MSTAAGSAGSPARGKQGLAVTDEAHGWGHKVACHAYNGIGLQRALDGGCDTIEHGLEMTDAQIAQMKRQGGGTIINMSSVAGVQAWAGTGAYSASKHGIMAMTKTLADEGRAHHIKVSALCPGGVADDLVDAGPDAILRSEKIDPFDIAEAAVYLATLGKYTVVHQIVIDRLGADW